MKTDIATQKGIKNYNPIILHGVNDEIWLENLDEEYRVVRLVSHYIHNNRFCFIIFIMCNYNFIRFCYF